MKNNSVLRLEDSFQAKSLQKKATWDIPKVVGKPWVVMNYLAFPSCMENYYGNCFLYACCIIKSC